MKEVIIGVDVKRRQKISAIIAIIIQLLSLITPFIMSKIVDNYIPERNTKMIIIGIIIFILVPLLSICLQTIYNYYTIKFIRQKGNELTLEVMRKLIYQSQSFYDKENSLEILSYVGQESLDYFQFYISDIGSYYVNLVIAIVIFALLIYINPYLAFLQLLYIPASRLPLKKIGNAVGDKISTVMSKNAKIHQLMGDIFKGIETIKIYCLEEKKLKEIDKQNKDINSIWGYVSALDTLSGIWISGFTNVLFTGITFGLGALLVLSNKLSIGQLIASISYCTLLYNCIGNIFIVDIQSMKNDSQYEKLFSYLEMDIENQEGEIINDVKEIEFRNVNFSYQKDKEILKDLNLKINKGEWIGIVGSSGIGKSTILDLILKLYKAESGIISINNTEISNISNLSLRNNICKVSQDIFLFPGTILDNLKLVNENACQKDIEEALSFACLDTYVLNLKEGINSDIGEAGKKMSGGEKQRLAIAQAILSDRKILLLDEVTSELDDETQEKLAINFKRLADNGYTIIATSHREQFLGYADKVYELNNGYLKQI